jgi:hypothetical protein
MTNEEKEPQRVTGRTAWDFAAEVAQRFGLSMLILAGIAYAFYKFEQVRQDATKSVQQQLNEAHKQLRETSVAIGNMNKTVVENIQGGLNTLQELQSRLKGLQEQANAEAKKAEDAITRQKEAERASVNAAKELEKVKLEHERIQKLRVAKSGPFRDKVKSLIHSLSQKHIDDPNIAKLAEEIRRDYIVDPCEILRTVAKDPYAANLKSLGDELEGLKLDTLKQIAQENAAAFASWMVLHGPTTALFGVVQTSDYEAIGLIFIEADEERIFSVDVVSRAVWLIVPDKDNWDLCSIVSLSIPQQANEEGMDVFGTTRSSFPVGQKSLSDLTRDFSGPGAYKVDILVPPDPALQPITFEHVQKEYPVAYKELVTDEEIAALTMMIHKAQIFNAANIVPVSLGQGHTDIGNLRAAIIQTLDAAVRRDTKERQNVAGENFPESDWGPLAAMALKPEFTVSGLDISLDRLEASVICSFRDPDTNNIFRAQANFKRAQALPQSQWHITGFMERPPVPRPSAAQQAY